MSSRARVVGAAAATAAAVPITIGSAVLVSGATPVGFPGALFALVVGLPFSALLIAAAARWWTGRRPAVLTVITMVPLLLFALGTAGGSSTIEAIATVWFMGAAVVALGALLATRGS